MAEELDVSGRDALRLYLFNGFRVEHDLMPISLPTRKVESLLAYLTLHPELHTRDSLAALFWGDVSDKQARSSLRKALSLLRQSLSVEILLADRQTVQINPDFPLWVDAHEFEQLTADCQRLAANEPLSANGQLQFALTLYRGELLEGFYDDWIFPLRERYRSLHIDTLLCLTQEMRSRSEYARAIDFANRVLAIDPAVERAHQHLMFCYLASGQRTAAIRQYEACQHLLAQELAADPLPETTALFLWIKQSAGERPAVEAFITNLPIPVSSFIGREKMMSKTKMMLRDTRLLTLTGPGGSGKTRLAIQIATDLIDAFPDGVWWVDLSPLMEDANVAQAIARTLGVFPDLSETLMMTLATFLRPKELLLVLDNCEHLIGACASLAHELLSTCLRLRILTTSREALGVPGEHILPVPTLTVPRQPVLSFTDLALQFEGTRLFVERAQSAHPSFTLTEQNALAIAQICTRLDGIPLAIELAATRVRSLSVEDILARLDDRFNLLTLGSRVAPPRHQTLRAVLDWSYDLLSEPEQTLFRQLSVYTGGFTLEAVQYVANATNSEQPILEILSRLVDKSLVVFHVEKARYSMLETVREFARELLSSSGELAATRERHFEYFCAFVQNIAAKLFGPENQEAANTLDAELDNIRAALAWSLDTPQIRSRTNRAERAIKMLPSLHYFYSQRGYLSELREWLDKLLLVDMPPSAMRAYALQQAGFAARMAGDFEQAAARLEQAIKMARAVNAKAELGWALLDMGNVEHSRGNLESAIPLYLEAQSLFQELGVSRGIGNSLYHLAETHMIWGNLEVSKDLWEQGLQHFLHEQDTKHIAWGLEGLGNIAFLYKDFVQAARLHKESLAYKRDIMDKLGIAHSFEGLAQVGAQQQPERAAMLWGAAERLRLTMKMPLDPSRQSIYTSLISVVRESLGAERFAEAWARGRAMPLEEALVFALGDS